MTTVSVSGLDTAAIHAARDAAGPGGTVFFPNGDYDVDGLTASVANQTWQFERLATLKRPAAATGNSVLTLAAPGLRTIGGVLDGNRANNASPANGILAPNDGCDLEMTGTTIQNVSAVGIAMDNAALILDRVTIKATTLGNMIWRSTSGPGRHGPQIDRCLFDRSMEPASLIGAGVLIQSTNHAAQFVLTPRITKSRFAMPVTSAADAVLLELLYCQRATIEDNVFTGGRIGVTYGSSGSGWIAGNKCQIQTSYAIELGCNDTTVVENYGSGYAASSSLHGITVNPACSGFLKVYGNTMVGYTVPVFDPSSRITSGWAN